MQEARKAVLDLAKGHYRNSDEPFYLASVGQALRAQGLWPVEDEKRSLKEWLCTLEPDVRVIQDETSPARVAIVTPEKEAVVEGILLNLSNSHLIKSLARPVLLAFCVRGNEECPVYLTRRPPFRYTLVTPPDPENYHTIAPERRLPGLRLQALPKMAPSDVAKLGRSIQSWADANGIALDSLSKLTIETQRDEHDEPTPGTMSALDRLLAAQRTDLRPLLVVPADIAVLLSRHR